LKFETKQGASNHTELIYISFFSLVFLVVSYRPFSTDTTSSTPTTGSHMRTDRPISPHVTIYSQPIIAVSSITNRVTGVVMSVGVIGVSLAALGGACDVPLYLETVKTTVPALMPILKGLVGFPLVYHTFAGIRHLVTIEHIL
jgi:succinate dehydrogenase cytochrome b556 subunit